MGMSAQQLLAQDPEYLARQLAQQEIQRYQNFQNPQLGLASTSGAVIGRGLANLFGGRGFFEVSDPALRRVADTQRVFNEAMTNFDPANPAASYEAMANRFSQLGFGQQAMMAAQEAAKYRQQERAEAVRTEELGIRKEDLELRRKQAAEAKETNLVTTNGDAIVKKEGKFFVQTTDDEGNVQLNPYSKKAYGPIETKTDYARAQAAAGGGIQRQTVYGAGGLPIGYDILDKQGNVIRRELFRGGAGTAAGPGQPAPGSSVPNIFQQELERRLKNK
jgi:hypothetical protein